MSTVAGDKHFKSLTIPHFKICLNAEHNELKKAGRKAVIDHCEEGNENRFYQFSHDGTALMNKDECQAFGIQFTDNKFLHINTIALPLRKPVSHESDKVAELEDEVCHE